MMVFASLEHDSFKSSLTAFLESGQASRCISPNLFQPLHLHLDQHRTPLVDTPASLRFGPCSSDALN
jgi:hypothetical protein